MKPTLSFLHVVGPSGETMQPHHRRWANSESNADSYPSMGLTESISAPANPAASPRHLETPPRPWPSPSRPGAAALRLAPPAVNGIHAYGSGSSLASEGSGDQTLNGLSRPSTVMHRYSGNLTDIGMFQQNS